MTAEHLRVLLHNERDSDLLFERALDLVRANIPLEILDAIRLGRMVALQKPGGGVIFSDEWWRRLWHKR